VKKSLFPVLDFFFRILSSSPLGKLFFNMSNHYVNMYNDYSYDFRYNGEGLLIQRIVSRFSRNAIVLDVGANQGDWTALVLSESDKLGGKVLSHCFEMSHGSFVRLTDRFSSDSRVIKNNVALSSKVGEISLLHYEGYDQLDTVVLQDRPVHNRNPTHLTVYATTGDEYCSNMGITRINLLKIDVEGAEYEVLLGFKSLFDKKMIDIVQFEYGYLNGVSGRLMHDFWSFFESRGYMVGKLMRHGVVFRPFRYEYNNFTSGPNFVACLPHYSDFLIGSDRP
jgi:FkbM family methyltransferase